MEHNEIKTLGNKKYRAVNFVSKEKGDIACNHCAFELGKCRGAIWILGQCYEVIGPDKEVIKNIYYEEVIDEVEKKNINNENSKLD